MDDSDPDWHLFCNLDACEPAGTGAADAEDRRATRSHPIDALQTSADPANTDPWQPIIGPGSIATGYVALADVAPVPPGVNVSPNVDFDTSSVCEKRFDASPEVEKSDDELLFPVLATVSSSGDGVDKAHSPVLDNLEGCTCLGCVQERPIIHVQRDDRFVGACCRIPPCTFSISMWSPIGNLENLPRLLLPLKFICGKELCSHEGTHFKHQGRYKCAEGDCGHLTKEWRDLKRHYRAKHCTKTPDFPCDVLGCKFGGENGFHRKDKLASHYKNIHQGIAASTTRRRNILPAPAKNEVSGPGIGQSSHQTKNDVWNGWSRPLAQRSVHGKKVNGGAELAYEGFGGA